MEVGALQFTQNATHLQRNIWWNHARMAVALTAASMLVIIGTVRKQHSGACVVNISPLGLPLSIPTVHGLSSRVVIL
uniref:Transmembrane protein n=1 Tax=Ascaris lumbricoides TaxID=6252 RepID=A0A0M3IJB3_ASCLU